MFKIKKQIRILYITAVFWNLSITGAWVAILAARGFSLVQIGLAETVFHITSLIFEVPSGVLADVIGRKKMLVISNIMSITGNMIMACTSGFAGVCISFVFQALSWNASTGSGNALAYDSLKMVGEEEKYVKYSSFQTIIYRITSGISTLCAGLALILGYRAAYLLSVVNHLITMLFLLGLKEVPATPEEPAEGVLMATEERMGHPVRKFFKDTVYTFKESFRFFGTNKKATLLVFSNALVGAFDVLLLFFLQSKLRESGLNDRWLGIALFLMEVGGILGARLVLHLKKWRYALLFIICTLGVLLGVALEHTGIVILMVLGGFISAASDDALQIRSDAKLQDMFASSQRATLISITSFVFSMEMIVLSPLAGWFFSIW